MCNEIMNDDIKTAAKINAQLRAHGGLAATYRHFDLYRIEPLHELIDVLEVDPVKIRAGMRQGRERAERALANGPLP
jgi:hypothetical protein